MDPITIIVGALAAGAAAGLADTAAQAIKDAYTGLKLLIQRKHAQAGASVDMLESDPGSKDLQGYVEKQLAKTNAAQDAELLQQAQAMRATVAKYDPEVSSPVTRDRVKGSIGAGKRLYGMRTSRTGFGLSRQRIAANSWVSPVSHLAREHLMQMLHSKAVPLNWVADARSKSEGRLTGLDSAAFGSSACAVGWWFRSLCSSGQRTEPNLATEARDCRPGQAVAPTVKPMGTRWSRVRARCR